MNHPIVLTILAVAIIICLVFAWKEDLFGTAGWWVYLIWCLFIFGAAALFFTYVL